MYVTAELAPSPAPTPSPVPPPSGSCIGLNKDFNGDLSTQDVRSTTYTGDTDEEKDASCCAQCDAEPQFEYWVRATDMDGCWLKKSFESFGDNPSRRGNFK